MGLSYTATEPRGECPGCELPVAPGQRAQDLWETWPHDVVDNPDDDTPWHHACAIAASRAATCPHCGSIHPDHDGTCLL